MVNHTEQLLKGYLLQLTSQICHNLFKCGVSSPLFLCLLEKPPHPLISVGSFWKCFDSRTVLFELFIEGLAVFGTCHVKTRRGLRTIAPVYVCIGRFYAVFVFPADGNRQRPEFRTGKALLAVRVVTVGGSFLQNHAHILHSASLIRSGLGRTAGVRRLLIGDNCGEQKERRKEIKALLTPVKTSGSPHIFAL